MSIINILIDWLLISFNFVALTAIVMGYTYVFVQLVTGIIDNCNGE